MKAPLLASTSYQMGVHPLTAATIDKFVTADLVASGRGHDEWHSHLHFS